MRIIVTGAAGFIGSTLVDRLLAEGHEVIGVDDLSTGRKRNLVAALAGKRFQFLERDIADPAAIGALAAIGADAVAHLAAQVDVRVSVSDPLADAYTNIRGTLSVLEACRRSGVGRFVLAASGGSRYGVPEHLPIAESVVPAPASPYAVAKVAAELYAAAYQGMYGISPIALALSNVYGPRQNPHGDAGVVSIFGSAMLAGRPTAIYGDGSSTRDYVFVDDVVEAFTIALAAPHSVSGLFNVGTGIQTSAGELHRLIAEELGVPDEPRFAESRLGEIERAALDPTAAREGLGWTPRTGLADGLRRTLMWLSDEAREEADLA